jgi:hypothetical protein
VSTVIPKIEIPENRAPHGIHGSWLLVAGAARRGDISILANGTSGCT